MHYEKISYLLLVFLITLSLFALCSCSGDDAGGDAPPVTDTPGGGNGGGETSGGGTNDGGSDQGGEENTYPIKSITIDGFDIKSFSIVTDTSDPVLMRSAELLKKTIKDQSGYDLPITSSEAALAISIAYTSYAGNDGFRAYVSGMCLKIECINPYFMEECMEKLCTDLFVTEEENMEFDNYFEYSQHIRTIGYCSYGGAVGDGVADDFEAIKRTHARANITGQTVVAEKGKIFNLGVHDEAISIKTSCEWGDAVFIIDDSNIAPSDSARTANIFKIASKSRPVEIYGLTSLKAGQKNIGMTFDNDVLLYIANSNKHQYIRYGINNDTGAPQQEIIHVDKNGNVHNETPIMWDYDTVTYAVAYDASEKPISISGGIFKTIANRAPREYTYYSRGISVNRSNVTIKGLTHLVTGEGTDGAPYNGFLSVSYAYNVLIDGCTFTAHKTYQRELDSRNNMGTYDTNATLSSHITWKNCSQTNSITDKSYWGIMGSNYCKNLKYDGCKLSRFDAHKGTHNATIINSEIGHTSVTATGSGTFLIENTAIHSNNAIALRGDYGSTWDGDVILRNITLHNTGTATLITASYANHDFGYTCHLPKSVTVDGITLDFGGSFYVFSPLQNGIDQPTVGGVENKNPVVLPEEVIFTNLGKIVGEISSNKTLYANVALKEQ